MPASVLHLHLLDLPGEEQGAFRHRILNSVQMLNRDPKFSPTEISWLAPDAPHLALAADILILHGLAGMEIEALIRRRRRAGRITLFEIGDELSAPRPWRRREIRSRDPLLISRQLLHASMVDGVQFSSAELHRKYAELNSRCAVLDNNVEFSSQPPHKPAGFVFGWAGTRSHKDDLAALVPSITAFCGRHRDAVFALMGDPELQALFSALPANQFDARPFGSYDLYRRFLASLHVGIAPLADTLFNSGRSDVKIIEMAAEGAVVLAQNAPAYRACDDAALLFDSATALEALLERLHADRDDLAVVASTGRALLACRRGEAATSSQHSAWYRDWPIADSEPLPSISAESGVLSARLEEAMRLWQAGDPPGALRAARVLLDIHPDYLQARWLVTHLLARCGATGEALESGAPLAACPIFSSLWYPLAANLQSDPSLRARSVVAQLRVTADTTTPEALTAYHQQLLDANPFHYFALTAERRRLEKSGDEHRAAILGRRLRLIDPSARADKEALPA